jgi:nitrogenase molybdenum-iron protein NifN
MTMKKQRVNSMGKKLPKYVSTTNACKLCTPMGASLAFRGIEGSVAFLHGSQGCATYMRRYIISHFNEPIDIASSSLGEKNAVFGGAANLKLGLKNVTEKYHPALIGVATTCLTETIGDDVPMILHQYAREIKVEDDVTLPEIVHVSTPSYSGTHMDGFHGAVKAVIDQLAKGGRQTKNINLLPGFVSPADIRHLKEIFEAFKLRCTILPDISDSLDGPALREYQLIPEGGTRVADIKKMGRSMASIEFGRTLPEKSAGALLAKKFSTPNHVLGLPMGIRETDVFFNLLEKLSSKKTPEKFAAARGRLIDSMVDGHKYVSGKRAIVYGEEDLVIGLTSLLTEIGVHPMLCATGSKSGKLQEAITRVTESILPEPPEVHEGTDFYEIAEHAETLAPDLLVGHSKGYSLAKKLDIPLIRLGFPIHDRLGGQRILHLGYHGAQILFDTIANALIQKKQDGSKVGYSYM